MTMGQRVTGHGSSGSTNLSGSRGSRVKKCDPLSSLVKILLFPVTLAVAFTFTGQLADMTSRRLPTRGQ